MCLCFTKGLESVKLVKEKEEKMWNNAQNAKEKARLQKWFKWDQECLLKWPRIAMNVKEKEIFLEKEVNAKHVKGDA